MKVKIVSIVSSTEVKNTTNVIDIYQVLSSEEEDVLSDEFLTYTNFKFFDCVRYCAFTMESKDDKDMKLCRLCFQLCTDNFDFIEEVMRAMFAALLLELDLTVTDEPIICRTCAENLKKLSDFKSICLQTEDYINSFVSNMADKKLDLMDIYSNKNGVKTANVPGCHTVCRLCMVLTKNGYCVPLNRETKDTVKLQILLDKYFPELNLYVTKDPVVCTACHLSLQEYSNFVKNCSYTEERIKKYNNVEGTNSKNQVSFKQVLRSMTNVVVKCEKHNEAVDEDGHMEVKIKRELPEYQQMHVKLEEVNVKLDSADFDRNQEDNNLSSPRYQCKICSFGTNRKARLKDHVLSHKDNSEVPTYRCALCTYETKFKIALKKHMLLHKNDSELTKFQCHHCEFKTKRKKVLKNHLNTYKSSQIPIYYCEHCAYRTKLEDNFKKHNLRHVLERPKDPSGMYQCDQCSYNTKHNYRLRDHMLVHKDASEITMFRCELCPFETKHKGGLRNHMKMHKDPSEVAIFQCETCQYKTKYSSNLNKHLLTHKDASKVTMYLCQVCTYETKFKTQLKEHMVKHIDISEESNLSNDGCLNTHPNVKEEITCESQEIDTKQLICNENIVIKKEENLGENEDAHFDVEDSRVKTKIEEISVKNEAVDTYAVQRSTFSTESKSGLVEHTSSHKTKTTMYRCETKCKTRLGRQLLTLKDGSEVVIYKCETCSFKTKYRRSLISHMLTHKDGSELLIYKCDTCLFKTKYKKSLERHMLTHKAGPEVLIYKCEACVFKTKHKESLGRHMLTHKDGSEVTIYKCEKCTFESKHKGSIRSHVLTHKGDKCDLYSNCSD